jgi:hypothetical protein
MIKTKLYNLFGLSMFFIVYSFTFFSQYISFNLIYPILAESSLLFLLVFIEESFYKGLKSPFLILLLTLITLKITDSIFRFIFRFQIPLQTSIAPQLYLYYYIFASIVSSQILLTMIWFFCSTLRSYKVIKNLKIEPWLKYRYIILLVSILSFALSGILVLFIPIEAGYENLFFTYSVAATIIIFSLGNLFGWLMPKKLKKFFNKNFEVVDDEKITEKELLEKIQSELKRRDEFGSN